MVLWQSTIPKGLSNCNYTPRDLAALFTFNPVIVVNLLVNCRRKEEGNTQEVTSYMKGALVARAELLELPSSSPSEVLYEDSNFLCIKMHRIQLSSFFQLRTTESISWLDMEWYYLP